MSEKQEIEYLWGLLQFRNKWYLDFQCPDNTQIMDIALKAKDNADKTLSNISKSALLGYYKKWKNDLPPVIVIKGDKDEKHFDNFLSDLAYSIGEKSLRGNEKKLFQESINLFIRFL